MIAPENVATFDDLAGARILRRYGYVSGIATRPRNRFRSTFRSLGMLVGLAAHEYLSDAEHLRREALEALLARANALGANAVIGLSFHVSEGSDGSCKVVAFGEAVHTVAEGAPDA
ncbi:MAG: heavy metal-binding domain-containing protein [bacterium]|nr:heavy metal-binding domain-containing protein [bacterium]